MLCEQSRIFHHTSENVHNRKIINEASVYLTSLWIMPQNLQTFVRTCLLGTDRRHDGDCHDTGEERSYYASDYASLTLGVPDATDPEAKGPGVTPPRRLKTDCEHGADVTAAP